MKSAVYREFGGLKTQFNPLDSPQNSFLQCENFLLNREIGALVKRGGSQEWAITGDVRGIGGYVRKNNAAVGTPVVEYPIVHRRNLGISYFDYYDWTAEAWITLMQGAYVQNQIGIGGITSFAQQDDLLCIAAGRPCQLISYSGTINRLGGPGPTTAPTAAAGAAGSLTSSGAGYRWCYTFYNSTTGWESSPSPYTDFVSLTAQKGSLSAIEATCEKEGVDKVRIYRTIETGEEPFLYVASINIGTTTYTDDTADDSLGVAAPDADDHNAPPDDCYICIAFQNRLWLASSSQLWYSKPYIGNPVDLEYFSPERVFDFPQRVTGLARFQQLLLVFLPPKFGITQIRAQTDGEFADSEFHPNDGTNWHHSISAFDRYLTFWGAVGPKLYDQSGPVDRYDEDIKNYLRATILREYNSNVFIWSVFHEETDQFLYCFSGNSQQSQWQDVVSGSSVSWQDSVTGASVSWAAADNWATLSGSTNIEEDETYNFLYWCDLVNNGVTYSFRVYKNGSATATDTGTVEASFDTTHDIDSADDAGIGKCGIDSTGYGEGRFLVFFHAGDSTGSPNEWRVAAFSINNNSTNINKEDYWRAEAGEAIPIAFWAHDTSTHTAAPHYQVYKDGSETAVASGTFADFDNANLTIGDGKAQVASIDTTGYADGLYTVFAQITEAGGDTFVGAWQFVIRTESATVLGQDCPPWPNLIAVDGTIRIPWHQSPYVDGGYATPGGTEPYRLYPAGSQTVALSGTVATWDSPAQTDQYMIEIDCTGLAAGQYHLFVGRDYGLGAGPPWAWGAWDIWIADNVPSVPGKVSPYTFNRDTTIYIPDPNHNHSVPYSGATNPTRKFRVFREGVETPVLVGDCTAWDASNMDDAAVAAIDTTGFSDGHYAVVFERENDSSADTGDVVFFRIEATSGAAQQTNLVFGVDPIRGLTGTYSWDSLANLNDSNKGISIGYVPRTKGANVSILQETLFLGSINAGIVMQTFRGDLALDNGTAISGRAITNRIDPSLQAKAFVAEEPGLKRFWDVEFFDVNPIDCGATFQYARDAKKPHIDAVTWEDFKGSSGARFAFNNGLARWTHLKIEDDTETANRPVLGGFKIRYIDFGSRERGPTNGTV